MTILCIELEEKLSLVAAEAESLAASSQTSQQKGDIISLTVGPSPLLSVFMCLMRRKPYSANCNISYCLSG